MEELKQNLNILKVYGIRYDSNFKSIYSKKENMKALFRDVFHEELEDFEYYNKEFSKGNIHLRSAYSDMILKTKKRMILLEVQNQDLKNFGVRLKRYVSMLYMNQEADQDYQSILPVEAYVIINYAEGKKKVLKEFSEYEKELKEEFDELSRIKVWNIKEALKEKKSIDYAYARLFVLDSYSKEEAFKILEESQKEPRLKELVNEIMMYNTDIKTYQRLKESEIMNTSFELETSMLRAEALEEGKKEGKKEGRMEGKLEGKKEGIMEGKIEDAKNLLKEGISLEVIARVTNLPQEQIKEYAGI